MCKKLLSVLVILPVVMLAGSGAVFAEQIVESTSYLPQFESSKPQLEVLEENLAKTGELAEILRQGNDELSEAIKQYRQDRTVEAKDRIYLLLGNMADRTVSQMDGIITNRDRMKDGLTEVLYKLDHMQTSLNQKKQTFSTYVENTVAYAEQVKDELRKLAKAIKSDPENKLLRKDFRKKLFQLRNLDHRHKTYQAHQRLNEKFGQQLGLAGEFFQQLDANTDQLFMNLAEQKEFLVMRVALLRDAARMESWLRGESESNISALAMVKKIGDLSQALEKFNAAADVLVEMNDIGTLIESLPNAGELFGFEGTGSGSTEKFEDKYVEYFNNN